MEILDVVLTNIGFKEALVHRVRRISWHLALLQDVLALLTLI